MKTLRTNLRLNCQLGLCVALLTGLSWVLAGCGKKDSNAFLSAHDKVFQSAPADIKAAWEAASNASKAREYATAITAFRKLCANKDLSEEQRKAAEETAKAVNDEMYEAANKGDPAGTKGIQDLRNANKR